MINTNEEVDFKIHVVNRGPPTMRDVTLELVGKNGAKVQNTEILAQFATETLTRTIDSVAGHHGENPHY